MSIDPFASARTMLDALDRREVSAVELLDFHLDRIDRHNPELNAVVVDAREEARVAADRIDTRRARGETIGPIGGLPFTVKESTQMAGLPQTAGITGLRDHRADEDSIVTRRLRDAGAVIMGKTNIPPYLGDWQSNNAIYGRTVNPWDHARSPGGSSGGGSAALAAGLTPVEHGSDIGGSIRVPAAFCGVYGHRPSESAVPRSGAFPPATLPNPVGMMGVQGPLARTADDLELMLDVIAGPEHGEDSGAWSLNLPAARHERLADFRVAIIEPFRWAPVSVEVHRALDEVASTLRKAGAAVEVATPPGVDFREAFDIYSALLIVYTTQALDDEERHRVARKLRESADADGFEAARAKGFIASAPEFLRLVMERERVREGWRAFFGEWDVALAPITMVPAFPHDDKPFNDRILDVDGRKVTYGLQTSYPSICTLPGLPATAFPVRQSEDGLPVGLQVLGPYLEDRTPIRFASLLERELGGFRPPERYRD